MNHGKSTTLNGEPIGTWRMDFTAPEKTLCMQFFKVVYTLFHYYVIGNPVLCSFQKLVGIHTYTPTILKLSSLNKIFPTDPHNFEGLIKFSFLFYSRLFFSAEGS